MSGDTRQLRQRASQGDAAAVDALVEEHLPQLEAFIRLRMGPGLRRKESAADLVQSVCREVLTHLGRYQHTGEDQFRRWLFTTALRKVSNRARYYQAERRDARREIEGGPGGLGDLVLEDLAQTLSTPSGALVRREEIEHLEQCFAALPDDYREVITLARVARLPHREIAVQMGRTENATRLLLSRALVALSELLQRNRDA